MVRSWSFNITNLNTWLNLWDDLITKDPSFTDRTFSKAPYVPSMVCELKYQNTSPGTTVEKSDSKKEAGFQLTGGSWDVDRSDRNAINLKNVNFKVDTNPTVLYVSITAI